MAALEQRKRGWTHGAGPRGERRPIRLLQGVYGSIRNLPYSRKWRSSDSASSISKLCATVELEHTVAVQRL